MYYLQGEAGTLTVLFADFKGRGISSRNHLRFIVVAEKSLSLETGLQARVQA